MSCKGIYSIVRTQLKFMKVRWVQLIREGKMGSAFLERTVRKLRT